MEIFFSFNQIVDQWTREPNDDQLYVDRNEKLFVLLQAFWRGEFEIGESVLTLDMSSGGRSDFQPVNRQWIFRILPVGEFPFRETDIGNPPYEALSKIQLHEYPENFIRMYFSRFTISIKDFRKWHLANQSGNVPLFAVKPNMDSSDEIGRRIINVLHKAENKLANNKTQKINSLAENIVPEFSDKKFECFGYEAIRKILYGTYGPARDRLIPGLKEFMGSKIT